MTAKLFSSNAVGMTRSKKTTEKQAPYERDMEVTVSQSLNSSLKPAHMPPIKCDCTLSFTVGVFSFYFFTNIALSINGLSSYLTSSLVDFSSS